MDNKGILEQSTRAEDLLYHYTSRDIGIGGILGEGELRFSPLGETNDPGKVLAVIVGDRFNHVYMSLIEQLSREFKYEYHRLRRHNRKPRLAPVTGAMPHSTLDLQNNA